MTEISEFEIKVLKADIQGVEEMMMIPLPKNGPLPLSTLSAYIGPRVYGLKYQIEQSSPWFV